MACVAADDVVEIPKGVRAEFRRLVGFQTRNTEIIVDTTVTENHAFGRRGSNFTS